MDSSTSDTVVKTLLENSRMKLVLVTKHSPKDSDVAKL